MSDKRDLQKAIEDLRDSACELPGEGRRIVDNALARIERSAGELRRSSSSLRTSHDAIHGELGATKRRLQDEVARALGLEDLSRGREAEIIRLRSELSVSGIRLAGARSGEFHVVKVKCLECHLHFMLCTWHVGRHESANLHCPECGQNQGSFLIWRDRVKGFIFELIPGNNIISFEA